MYITVVIKYSAPFLFSFTGQLEVNFEMALVFCLKILDLFGCKSTKKKNCLLQTENVCYIMFY